MPSAPIRRLRPEERRTAFEIINAAAERYRGVIPEDRWHDPYMGEDELAREMEAGVAFWAAERDGRVVGVMGLQPVKDVVLIRHAYVLPNTQGQGIGSQLINSLIDGEEKPVLVGTWAAAGWAIGFYQRHGFALVPQREVPDLLRTYWSVPDRQIETSVVLRLRR